MNAFVDNVYRKYFLRAEDTPFSVRVYFHTGKLKSSDNIVERLRKTNINGYSEVLLEEYSEYAPGNSDGFYKIVEKWVSLDNIVAIMFDLSLTHNIVCIRNSPCGGTICIEMVKTKDHTTNIDDKVINEISELGNRIEGM